MAKNNAYLLVCEKEINNKGRTFNVYYGYRQEPDIEKGFKDIVTPRTIDGKETLKAIPIKVRIEKEYLESIKKELSFPLRFELSEELKLEDGRDSYYVNIDKDADKVARKDKYGKKHLVCVIRKAVSLTHVEPRSFGLDDLDDFDE